MPVPRRSRRATRATAPRPTIHDVARRAGVSLGTVSNVLNGRDVVSEARKASVTQAIRTLGYVPNGVAQSLRRQRSRVVGLCAPLTSSAYFAALLDAFEDIAAAQGYEVMQVLSRQDPKLELRRIRALIARKVDGIVIIPSAQPQEALDAIVASHVPAVVVDRLADDDRFDYVTQDDDGAMRATANALLDLGHRRIAYVVRYPALVTTRRRIAAFRATLRTVDDTLASVVVRDPDDRAFERQIDAMLGADDAPTAVVASNSMLMLALLRSVQRRGLAIPRDLSLVTFDAPEWADVVVPPLAVVRPPAVEIARTAWARLLRRMDTPALPTERVVLSATLELRGSVAVPTSFRSS